MNVNLKTEALGEIGNVVDLSSEEEGATAVSSQNNAIAQEISIIKQPERPRTPETICSICLEELNNKCYSDACWHLFCFDCLKRWSTIQASCPLCKKQFKCIYHTFIDEHFQQTFNVPRRITSDYASRSFLFSNPDTSSIFRMNLFLDIVRRNERLMHSLNSINDQDPNHNSNVPPAAQLISLQPRIHDSNLFNGRRQFGQTMRIRVYNENLWADPLPDLSGRFRDCSCDYFRENPAQTHRLHSFILRDILAVRSIERTEGFARTEFRVTDESIISLILQTILRYDIRDLYMINLLRPYIGSHSQHFVHELHNYANSPYDMVGYDRNVRYNIRPLVPSFYQIGLNVTDVFEETPRRRSPVPMPLPLVTDPRLFSETIVLDTDDEENENNTRLYGQEIIIVSSTNEDDSDVEILSHSYHPLETLDSFRDQPSTSTGIRDSLDRPNNRYNLRRRRLFSPILNDSIGCPVHLSRLTRDPAGLRRGRIILDSSSSEDDSFTPTRSSQTMHIKSAIVLDKKKRKVKKKKLKKRKRTVDDSRPELRTDSRSRSNSGSSSSFSDTDTRPNNNCLPLRTNIVL